jgi:hypothetical protein
VTAVALSAALVTAVSCAIATAQSNVEVRLRKLGGDADARLVQCYGEDFGDDALETFDRRAGLDHQAPKSLGRLHGSLACDQECGLDRSEQEDGDRAHRDDGRVLARWPVNHRPAAPLL